MKQILITCLLTLLVLISCTRNVENPEQVYSIPSIYPDYIDVTIPVDIAPMNFEIEDEAVECIDVAVKGSKGGEMHVQGAYADFDVDKWHELTEQNEGGELTFTVCVQKEGKWLQYEDFKMYVSKYHLDDYGLTYRRIAPGYEVGGYIGMYQRDLHSFDEETMLKESAVPGQCMNCHTANRCSATEYLLHVRGDKGGTMVMRDGKQVWLNTKTDSTRMNCGYSYWHHSGKYIASSINKINQLFFTGKDRRIEVFDSESDVVVIDATTNELILNERLMTNDFETYPVFSADGKTMYYCTAKYCQIPAEYDKQRYSLCSIPFDEKSGTFGAEIDTLLNASTDSLSFTYPRPSYDGRWLMYCVSDFGNFPINHKESDLWLMDLKTKKTRPVTEVNSDDSESFHNWSTDSHWFVFSSRRGDGMYNKAYIACIDDSGKMSKPFLLPQRNPRKYYDECFESFNCPDFTKDKIDFDVKMVSKACLNNERVQVKIR